MKQHINISVDSTYNVHSILKKYSAIRHSLFNYWSLLFYNKYLYYFFNCFLQRGKKQLAIKIVYFLLYTLKKKTMISPILVLQAALLNYRHILKLNIIKYKRKKVFSYMLLSLNKQVKISIKYLAQQFFSFNIPNAKYSLVERLSIFILNLFFRTPLIFGRFLQYSSHVHKLIIENKKTFKRAKFKKFKRKRRRNKFKFRWRRHYKKSYTKKQVNLMFKNKKMLGASLKKVPLISKSTLKRNKKKPKIKLNKKKTKRILQALKLKRSYLFAYKKRRQLLRKNKSIVLKGMKRRIRKVLVHSFIQPLKKRHYKVKKNKLSEYKSSLKNLYTDTNTLIDFEVLNEIQTINTFFINSISQIEIRKLFFYLILGKWYKLLEKVYCAFTSPFWHLYNVRARYFRHPLSKQPLIENALPQMQGSYTKYLVKNVNNALVLPASRMRSSSNFNVDSSLLMRYSNLYRQKIKANTKVELVNDVLLLTFKSEKKEISSSDKKRQMQSLQFKDSSIRCSSFRQLFRRKGIRKMLRTKSNINLRNKIKMRLFKLFRVLYAQNVLKIKRRTYSSFIAGLFQLKRYFFILIRFRLIRLVWFGLKAVALRYVKPLRHETRKIIATRAFLIKN